MQLMNSSKLTPEENETTIAVDHFGGTFAIYTTARKVAGMLQKQFPDHYSESPDKASATANGIPLEFICKLQLSRLK